ncbi:MAG: DUF2561 family protein [Mycobacterium sp.]
MVGRYATYRRGDDSISPEVVDRILIGACAAVWLMWLGASVVALVALVDLGRGFRKVAHNSHTSWILYSIIIVSAIVIAGAIPVLIRARRMSHAEPVAPPAGSGRPPLGRAAAGPPQADQGDLVKPASTAEWSGPEVDRLWLRGTISLAGAMGVALIGVAVATYLMAVGRIGPSWVSYGLAGTVTATMPVIEWFHVRRLRALAAQT